MKKGLLQARLVEAREAKGYNRKDFSDFLSIPYRTITNYENGSREPGSDYLIRVADACECTVDWLLGIENSNFAPIPESISPDEQTLISLFRSLNEEGREKLLDYADDLAQSGKYIKTPAAGVSEA